MIKDSWDTSKIAEGWVLVESQEAFEKVLRLHWTVYLPIKKINSNAEVR